MKSNSRLGRNGIKLGQRIRNRTKISMKSALAIYTFGSVTVILFFFVFNMSSHFDTRAKEIEIIPLQEQEFSHEMSLPEPFISKQRKGGPNSIYLYPVKKQDTLHQNHE